MNKDKKIAQLEAEINNLKSQNNWLMEQLKLAKHQRFGASSEQNIDQLSFFNEAELESNPEIFEPTLEEITYKRKKQKGKRELDFSGLPVEQIIHELPENERICADCGGNLHACAHDVARRELAVIPAQFKVIEHVQTSYSCRNCEQSSDHVPIKKSLVPNPVIKGSGVASPSLLAQIIHNKYTLAMPLYRQEQELKRININILRQNMANWIILSSEKWLSKIFVLMKKELLKNEILHADETTVQVLHEDGKTAQSNSYMWLYRTSGDAENPIIIYEYQPSRSSDHPKEFLSGFNGFLHSDGYSAYHSLENVTNVGCWAHMRRKFADVLKTLPKEIREKSPAAVGLSYCENLFILEKLFSELSFDERFKHRNEKSKLIAKDFFKWVKLENDSNPLPRSLFGSALNYAVSQEKWLMNVFKDGRLEISNNRIERSVRPFAVGRKNWLFCNTPKGAKASSTIYSIIETAKANNLKPLSYLKFLFEILPNLKSENLISDYLPWSKSIPDHCFSSSQK